MLSHIHHLILNSNVISKLALSFQYFWRWLYKQAPENLQTLADICICRRSICADSTAASSPVKLWTFLL